MATVTQWVRVNKNTKKEYRIGMVFEVRVANTVVGHAEVKSAKAADGELYLRAVINTKGVSCLDVKQNKAVFSNNFFFGFAIYEKVVIEETQTVTEVLVSKANTTTKKGTCYIARPYRAGRFSSTAYSIQCLYEGQVEITDLNTGRSWSEEATYFSEILFLNNCYLYWLKGQTVENAKGELVDIPVTGTITKEAITDYWIVWSPSAKVPPSQKFVSRKQAKKVACIMSERTGDLFYYCKIEGSAEQGVISS